MSARPTQHRSARRRALPLAFAGLLAVAAPRSAAALQERAGSPTPQAGDPAAVVFVPDRCGANDVAPGPESHDLVAVLTDVADDDPYFAVARRLLEAKAPCALLRHPPGDVAAARPALLRLRPGFVLVVTRPDRIDANRHFDLLELAAGLDADPFTDFAFGYVTGATPAEALAFVERFLAVRAPLPKSLTQFGPIERGEPQFGGPRPHRVARGWREWFAFHGAPQEMIARRELLAGRGVLLAFGHGLPDGIVGGLSGNDLRAQGVGFAPAVYVSGPCYGGVTGNWFAPEWGPDGARVVRRAVAPERSFALAVLASGATALFAGFEPDRAETAAAELEHLWMRGGPLGFATKETYDTAALALRAPAFALYRYEEGAPPPYASDIARQMIGGACGRALFGDPTFAPIDATVADPFAVAVEEDAATLRLTWTAASGPAERWSSKDVFRCDGYWTDRIRIRREIGVATARALTGFAVERLEATGERLEGRFATAMVERWGGRAFLHVWLVFPRGSEPFARERDFAATFRFAKTKKG